MMEQKQTIFLLEKLKRNWVTISYKQLLHRLINTLPGVLLGALFGVAGGGLIDQINSGILGELRKLFSGNLTRGNVFWVTAGAVVFGLFWWFFDVNISEVLKWSWRKAWKIGLSRGLISGLFFGVLDGLIESPIEGLLTGLLTFLVSVLFVGLLGGFETAEIEIKTTPNQGIRQSLRNCGIVFLIFGLICGLVLGLIFSPITGAVAALAFAIGGGLTYGGDVVIYHYTLRFFLWNNGCIPWDYIGFLDHCVDLIFLRRVGGGYIFVHRLLMEHFAAMYPKEQ
jgi:hypothetical protein